MCAIEAKRLEPRFRDEIAEKFCTDKDPLDFNNCLTCGMCSAGCPFNAITDNADPRKFIRQVLLGMKEEVINSKFIWVCTQCGRCTMECPMNVDIKGVVRTIRGNFAGRAPGFLQDIVDAQIKTGNQMEVTNEDYLDTLEWMAEELQDEMSEELGYEVKIEIPVDKEGAEFLFLWDPREIKYYPQDIQSITKIMWAAGADWTVSSKWWDATHYGLFNGNDEESRILLQRYADEVKRLKVKGIVVTECGHAYWSHYWGRKVWLDPEDANYWVMQFTQMEAKWIKEGRIKLDKTRNPDPVTFHDPCNLVRKGGVVEEPRYCLQNAVMDFREMWPNREWNYCCGGGGGTLALGDDYKKYLLDKGRLKAEQIKATGAKIVCTPCHNCFDQLTDNVVKPNKLDVKVMHVHHLVSNALILPDKKE